MMPHTVLSDLEATIGCLIVDLLRAPTVHPELILSPPVNSRGGHSSDAVRLTLHYISALLAYGLSEKTAQLERAISWFATPFAIGSRINTTEMNRLEALLILTPRAESFVQPRLAQLTQQQGKQVGTFFIHGRGAYPFDTLWALKVLALAQEHQLLNGKVDSRILKQGINRVMRDVFQDKDLALAMRLRCEQHGGKLTKTQQKSLTQLIKNAHENGGIWGEPHDIEWVIGRMEQRSLSPGDVAEFRDTFREVVLSTCYVIENLAPLRQEYPEFEEPLSRAVQLWWHTFCGEDAVKRLQAIFPKPYDYLFIVARTFVALHNYLGRELKHWGEPYVHNQLALHLSENKVTTPENLNIKHALKNWIQVELIDEPEPLKLGMSSSNIVRIKPHVPNPLYPDNPDLKLSLPETLIVKYGPIEEVDLERINYTQLPSMLQNDFVRIPDEAYIDTDKQCAYIIMPDLHQYQTLYERLHMGQLPESLINELTPFLMRMYTGGMAGQSRAQRGAIRKLYLVPMLENLDRIFNFVAEIHALIPERDPSESERIQSDLLDQIGRILRFQLQLQDFPTTCMHGDLHSRNIMLWRTRRGREGSDFMFKLIDLEKFQRDGDAALDAGQLLIDLEILRADFGDRAGPISTMMDHVEQAFVDFAEEIGDSTFHIRLHLAQARALIRIAKGLVKQGEQMLNESRRSPAMRLSDDVIDQARLASALLNNVLEGLEDHP